MNQTDRSNIVRDIFDTIAQYPQNTAFVIQGQRYSYEHLGLLTASLFGQIKDLPEAHIGVMAQDSIETYASMLAVLFAGKGYVILHPSYPKERLMKIARNSGLTSLIAPQNHPLSAALSHQGVEIIDPANQRDDPFPFDQIVLRGAESDNAYIIFTSGSTGEPKGVPITRANLNAFYRAYHNIGWKLDQNDRMLQMFELTFDVSVVSTFYPLTLGASIYTVGSQGVKYLQIFDILEEYRLTFAAVAPSVLQLFSPYFDQISLPDLKYLIVTAEASQADLLSRFQEVIPNGTIYNLYGPTEGTIYCTFYPVSPVQSCKQHNGMVAIGRPFDGIKAEIMDEEGNPLPEGTMGEMWISGKQVMTGYLNSPQQTALSIVHSSTGERFYKTGDLCVKDPEGDIIYCGRKDYQVKIQGFRIELSEIEYTAKGFFDNRCQTVVVPILDNGVCNELHLAVELDPCDELPLRQYLSDRLPDYMIPKKIHFINPFPTSTSNKTDRRQISILIQGQ